MARRGPGVAGKAAVLEGRLMHVWKIVDYWKVRALRAEGHDVPARPHPGRYEGGDEGVQSEVS